MIKLAVARTCYDVHVRTIARHEFFAQAKARDGGLMQYFCSDFADQDRWKFAVEYPERLRTLQVNHFNTFLNDFYRIWHCSDAERSQAKQKARPAPFTSKGWVCPSPFSFPVP